MAQTRRYKRRSSKKQKAWEYMRRNKPFRAGDMMMILDLEKPFTKQLLWHLEKAGYVRLENDPEEYRDRAYTLMKDTGVKSPSIINHAIYDYNTEEVVPIDGGSKKEAKNKLLLLKAMTEAMMTRIEITAAAGVKSYSGQIGRYFSEFEKTGIMTKSGLKKEQKIVYKIDREKCDDAIRNTEKSV